MTRIARHISWDSRSIFCPLNVGFCEFSCQKQKNQHGGEGVQLFVGIWVQQGVTQLSVTRIAGRWGCRRPKCNGPLALRGHVTNASFKQWVGISLMPKIDRAHKNYLTAEIWEETHLREIFYGTLIFQQSSMICIGRHIGGHTLALQHGGQNYFMLISC